MIRIDNLLKRKNNKLKVISIFSQIIFIILVLGYCFIKKSTEQMPNIILSIGIFLCIICNWRTKEKKIIGEILLIISISIEIILYIIKLTTGLNNQICMIVILEIVFNICFFICVDTLLIKNLWKYNYILITVISIIVIANSLINYLQGNCSIIVALKYVSVLFTIPYFYWNKKYKIEKESFEMKNEKNKKSKEIIIITILAIFIIAEIICFFTIKLTSSKEEKIVYDIVYRKQGEFKNPSTVKITDATIYDGKYIILQMGGNNSFGAFVKDTYYIKDNTLYTKDDNYTIAKEIIEKCFECEKNNSENIQKLNENSINKINNKLEKRYK